MNQSPKGVLYTTSLARLSKLSVPRVWVITRYGNDIKNTRRVTELAPSPQLYQMYMEHWRGRDPETWWEKYKEIFLRELAMPEKRKALRELWNLLQEGQDVALACYCSDGTYCHRRLVGEFLGQYGVQVVELAAEPCLVQGRLFEEGL
ncbi:MAG: DUF488 family protein [Bacillota bacterium]|uniref:DUF488 family protein, N3 subclade n=1 Tax=Desulfurispora thermophila TaxID=265470 RepID=UPI00035D06EE|nr:DUF488 family protein [Desulfurispora thermophila]